MEDNIFDKIFEEKLNTTQQFEFEEAAWLDVEQRLEPQSNRRGWWLMAASITLPMLMMGAYFYMQLRSANSEIVALKNKVEQLQTQTKDVATHSIDVGETVAQQTETTSTEKSETTLASIVKGNERVLKAMTNTVNTVKKANNTTIVSPSTQKSPSIKLTPAIERNIEAELAQVVAEDNNQVLANNTTDIQNNINSTLSHNDKITTITQSRTNEITTVLTPKALAGIEPFKARQQRITSNLPMEIILRNEKSGRPNPILLFKPEGFKVGAVANGGAIISRHKGFAGSIGISAEVLFPENVSLGSGFEYVNLNHLQLDWSQTMDMPEMEPLQLGDQLKRIELDRDWVQVPVYLKYVYERPDKDFHPFVRVGGIARKSIKKQYIFVFENLDANEEYQRESAPEADDFQNFAMNTVTGGVGLAYDVNDNINVQFETFVNHDMVDKNVVTNLDMVGMHASVTCSF